MSALSATAPTAMWFEVQASNDDFLEAVTYTKVPRIVKQCELAEKVNGSAQTADICGGSCGPGGGAARKNRKTNSVRFKNNLGVILN